MLHSQPPGAHYALVSNDDDLTNDDDVDSPNEEALASFDHILPSKPPSPSLRPHDVSTARLYSLSVANFGIGFYFDVEFALITPFFSRVLHAGPVISHSIWLLGPVTGIVVAPVVGVLSDRCTSALGRRRPFIAFGALALTAAVLAFPHTAALPYPAAGLLFAASLVAINILIFPLRALQADLVSPTQHHQIQGATSAMAGAGDAAAQILLALVPDPLSHAPFTVCAIVVAVSMSYTILIAPESALPNLTPTLPSPSSASISTLLTRTPRWMLQLSVCTALCVASVFCIVPNLSTWLGASVLGGRADAPVGSASAHNFERGIAVYGRAGILRSALQILVSILYPHLIRRERMGITLSAVIGIFGLVALAAADTQNVLLAELVVVLFGFPTALTYAFPFAEVAQRAVDDMRGLLLGLLNAALCVAQLFDTLTTGPISSRFGEAFVLRVGGVWGLIAAIVCYVLWPV